MANPFPILPQPRGVELSTEGYKGCHSRKVRLFELIELSVAVKQIYLNKTKINTYVFEILLLTLVSSGLYERIYGWRISQSGFDPNFEYLA